MFLLSKKDVKVLKCPQKSQEENGDHVKAEQKGRLLRRDTPEKPLAWRFGLRMSRGKQGLSVTLFLPDAHGGGGEPTQLKCLFNDTHLKFLAQKYCGPSL